ncbi:MAG: hypothetical protein CMH83_00715 [Nocardioides sp.]|nr:hypothetical protein [Nocardioides sp.]
MVPVDTDVIGRRYPAGEQHEVTAEAVRAFAEATGATWSEGDPVPATYPIVAAFRAMTAFLDAEGVDLSRIVHGEQRFAYERPLAVGDRLDVELVVASLRAIGGNEIVGTASEVRDADGALVCTGKATLVHRGDA